MQKYKNFFNYNYYFEKFFYFGIKSQQINLI